MNKPILVFREFEKITVQSVFEIVENKKLAIKIYNEIEDFAKENRIFSIRKGYIQPTNYVGLIETDSSMIEILPKIYGNINTKESKLIFINLLKILYNLPKYQFFENGKFNIENLPLLEIFIKMFLDEVEFIIKKGLKSDYILREDNLNFLKGKLLINKQISKNFIHKNKFQCEYDEYHLDRSENRILKTALKFLLNKSNNFENKKRIRIYMEHLYNVELSKNIEFDFKNIKINRHTNHYKIALKWAEIFLKSYTFSPFGGNKKAFSILYPMEKLFENYVGYLLENKSEVSDLKKQKNEIFVNSLLNVRADFVFECENEKVVGDAKWKNININDANTLTQSDFYQVYAYSKIYGTKKVKLFYPRNESFNYDEFNGEKFKYFDGTEIEILSIDIKKINKDY